MGWRADLTWALPLSRRHSAVRFFGSHFHKPLSLLSYSSVAFEFIVRHINAELPAENENLNIYFPSTSLQGHF